MRESSLKDVVTVRAENQIWALSFFSCALGNVGTSAFGGNVHLQTDRIWGQHIKVMMRPPEMIREFWGAADWNEKTNNRGRGAFSGCVGPYIS